jgi:hypothetical protein
MRERRGWSPGWKTRLGLIGRGAGTEAADAGTEAAGTTVAGALEAILGMACETKGCFMNNSVSLYCFCIWAAIAGVL